MTEAEATELVARIGRLYPQWSNSLSLEEKAGTVLAWAEEIYSAGRDMPAGEAWQAIRGECRHHGSPWPPGIFDLAKAISGRKLRLIESGANEERKQLAASSDTVNADEMEQRLKILRLVSTGQLSVDEGMEAHERINEKYRH